MSVIGGSCAIKVGKRETREQGRSQECARATTGNAALTKLCLVGLFLRGQMVAKESLGTMIKLKKLLVSDCVWGKCKLLQLPFSIKNMQRASGSKINC